MKSTSSGYYASTGDLPCTAFLTDPWAVTVAVFVDLIPDSTLRYIVSNGPPPPSYYGWHLRSQSGVVTFYAANSTHTAYVQSDPFTIDSGHVGKTLLFTYTFDGATLHTYVAGSEIGSGVALTGGITDALTFPLEIGAGDAVGQCTWGKILGFHSYMPYPGATSPTAPSASDILTNYTACKVAGSLVPLTGGTEMYGWFLWNVQWTVPSADPWTSTLETVDLSRSGSVTGYHFAPNWL